MKVYRFFWSPEGRPMCDITAASRVDACTEFRKQFPNMARYMGEIYVEVNPRDDFHYVPKYKAKGAGQ